MGALLCAVGVALAINGCGGDSGPERAEVSGSVTFAGQPIETGSIAFIPDGATSGPSVGGSIRDGMYHIPRSEGPVIGTHRILIQATRPTGQQVEAGEGADDPAAMVDEVEMYIPERYNRNSELTADVQPGSNQFDFALEGDGS